MFAESCLKEINITSGINKMTDHLVRSNSENLLSVSRELKPPNIV